MISIEPFLKCALNNGASDLHLSSGMPPMLRIQGEVQVVEQSPLTEDVFDEVILPILDNTNREIYQAGGEIDSAFSIAGLARVRLHVFRHMNGRGAAFRLLPESVPSLNDLNLPEALKQVCSFNKGLVLVCGPTGSGKSSTLAALINEINGQRRSHIITLEDPIEYIHQSVNSIIHQREVGVHTESFQSGLKMALREDPDVILLGEMRDLTTILMAVQASETGHLVLSTLHTNSAAEAVDRIVDSFSADRQQQMRMMLANTLLAVIAQRLVPTASNSGRVALMEILVATKAVKNLIREGKSHQLESIIQTGRQHGMQTFEQSFKQHQARQVISPYARLEDWI